MENRLFFLFDGNKYTCDNDCIQLFNANVEHNLPLIHLKEEDKIGNLRVKEIIWNDGNLVLRFNPFDSKIIYWQKVIDTLFLSIIAAMLYGLVFEPLIRKLK